VVIGPVFDATAAKADQWVPIRLGTDAALALAMMNVIIERGAYDEDYLARFTVGPFLVREDNKLFARDGNKYLVWDKTANAAAAYDSTTSPALLGSFTLGGVCCKPAFQLLVERASQYTPEKAAGITGVPAETIRELALEYVASKPAAIRMYHGIERTFNNNLGCRAMITLAAITGNIGIPGGGACTTIETPATSPATPRVVLNNRGVASPPGVPGMKTIPGSTNAMKGWAAIREGKPYPVKALISCNQNRFHTYGHIDSHREILAQLDLFVDIDIFMTWTARYADIVLPETTIFERDDVLLRRDAILRMEKAIEPLYESRPALEIWSELGRRVGLGQYFEHTTQDYIRMLLDSGHPSVAGITPERLEKEKIVSGNISLTPTIAFPNKQFPTPSGRIEFYQERLLEFGEELPIHKERLESPVTSALAEKYPLTFLTVKTRTFTHTLMANVDWMREIDPEPMLDINPLDAERRGIKDNDMVLAFNDRGRVKLKARLNEAMPPGTVNVSHGWWPEQFAEGHSSDLAHRADDLSIVNPSLDIEPIISDRRAAAHLIYWDCLVEVKKS
jgi:molybdopterin-containing oxidoreductase family molybdopterin binding subunit